MPLDYFVWALRSGDDCYVIDTGFGEAQAKLRKRTLIKPPAEGLRAIGIEPNNVLRAITTHLHYDHCGNYDLLPQVRYYEVKLANGDRHIMLPSGFVQWPNFGLWGNDRLLVKAITSAQFSDVPAIKRDDTITLLEEDKVMAYFAGGHLYATAARSEPII